MNGHLASYILFLLAEQATLAVQLHYPWMNFDALSHHLHLPSGVSKVVIGRYPLPALLPGSSGPPDSPLIWGITLSGSERVIRWVGDELTRMLCGGATNAQLAGVRELWLADVSPAPCDEPHILRAAEANQVRAIIQDMSSLETVVLVNQFQAPWTGAPPSLRLLPNAREGERHVGPRPSMVRIAHGYGKHVLQRWSERPDPTPAVPALDLTGVLEELASGAYDYVRNVVIEVPYHVAVDAGDIERLREHCDTVQVKVVDVTPAISLPAYCYESAAWAANDVPWPYKLW
ncbi:hypothetical protein TRAPUB_1172 [Trametes pubescens]|uniref:Uncharacterized protein n=1 Tax=Trametes pubescens TaxID=154538 RepID=A0A1M2VK06_TRAPU|nr:hypothetical protein TRAPUB_1172 [Trametes pubescens]